MNISRLVVCVLAVCPLLAEQARVWLRTGGPNSRKFITGITQTSPALIISPGHGFTAGDTVWISFMSGNASVNGVRRVQSADEDSFTITDLEGNPVAASWPAADITPLYPGVKGYVGRVAEHTLVETLGGLTDGPGGAITESVRDPDGTGPRKAPKANGNWGPYSGMQRRLASFIAQPSSPAIYRMDPVVQGTIVQMAALDWFMDNQRVQSLAAARHWLNNFDKFLSTPTFTACNEAYRHCGKGSFGDWMAFQAANLVYAYAMVYSQLSPGERKAFIDKMMNGFEEGCRNDLEVGSGTVSVAAGSTTVTGTDTKFLTEYAPLPDGRLPWMHLRTNPSPTAATVWVQVRSVESDTSLTVTTPVSQTTGFNQIAHWYTRGWESSSCGVVWFTAHHGSSPNLVARRADASLVTGISAADETLRIDAGGEFPATAPFHVLLRTGNRQEGVLVTRRDGLTLTVKRGQLMTQAADFPARSRVTYISHPLFGGLDFPSSTYFSPLDSPAHNLTFSKVYGYLTIGMILGPEDDRARRLFEKTWNYFYDFQYPHMKARWTGITQGAYSYGPGRFNDWSARIAISMRNSVRPPVDITDGNWLKYLLLYPIYITMPYNPRYSMRYGDTGAAEEIPARYLKNILIAQELYRGTAEAAFSNFWYRSVAGLYDPANWYNADSQNSVAYAILYTDENDPATDYRSSLPPYFFFNTTDFNPSWNPGVAYNAVVSRQNWSPSSTYLWVSALSQPTDHLGSYPGPASYKIVKEQYLLGENGSGTQGSGGATLNNAVQVGASTNLKIYSDGGGQVVYLDRTAGSDEYVYFRVNTAGAYRPGAKLEHIYRHFVHLKRPANDYVVVYDDILTKEPNKKLIRLHYFADNNETPSLERDGGTFVFTRVKSRLSSRVLLPSEADITATSRRPTTREIVHAIEIDGGENTQAEFLVVHRPSSRTDDMMPGTVLLADDPQFRAVLIQDPKPAVLVFPKDGSRDLTALQFSSQTAGATEFVVSGLSPGAYRITAGGTVLTRNVRRDGSLHFEAEGGTIAVERIGLAALEILAEPLPLAATTQSYFVRLRAEGGQEPYTWTVEQGALPRGLTLSPAGVISGVPENIGVAHFTVNVTDSAGMSVRQEMSITVMGVQWPLTITQTALPGGIAGQPYEARLTASGGVSPYRLALTGGELPSGVALSEEGLLSGIPETAGQYRVTVRVTDATGTFIERTFDLSVTSSAEPLRILSASIIEVTEGEFVFYTFEAAGGLAPYFWDLSLGELPEGLGLDQDGILTGTPLAVGQTSFRVRVTDSQSPEAASAEADFLLTVSPAPVE